MVGTRSGTTTKAKDEIDNSVGGDENRLDTDMAATRGQDEATSPLRRSSRSTRTSLERLPGSICDGGGSSDGTFAKASGRPSLRSGERPRMSTRTSLERLPLPPPPAVASPMDERDPAGCKRASPRAKCSSGRTSAAASAGRINSELNALLGLDAAVSWDTSFLRPVCFATRVGGC